MIAEYETFIESHDCTQIYLYPRYTSRIKMTLRTWTLFACPKSFSDFFDMRVIMNQHINSCMETESEEIVYSNLGYIHPRRLNNALVIGRSHKEFLYIDAEDENSVWILFTETTSVQKVSENFRKWLANSETETSYVKELMQSLENGSSSSRKRVKRKQFS